MSGVGMDKQRKLGLSAGSVAIMYLGTIMGAGFASGREAWQYFGLFGNNAVYGIAIATFLFVAVGFMTCYLAITLNTAEMGKIILPFENRWLSEALGYLVAVFIYTALVSMSAAGGALLYQQFGISKIIGGLLVVGLTIATVLGDFQRVSKVFRVVTPILFTIDVLLCIAVILTYDNLTDIPAEAKPTPMAATWGLAAFVYVAYNVMGTIPIMAHSAIEAKNRKSALVGAALGGVFIGALGLLLVIALQMDGQLSHILELPMLGFASKLGKFAGILFTLVLFFAMYSAATSTYYGFCTKLKMNDKWKYKVIIFALIGFALGMFGFKNIVAYVYPVEGYFGLVIIGLITINFVRSLLGKREVRK